MCSLDTEKLYENVNLSTGEYFTPTDMYKCCMRSIVWKDENKPHKYIDIANCLASNSMSSENEMIKHISNFALSVLCYTKIPNIEEEDKDKFRISILTSWNKFIQEIDNFCDQSDINVETLIENIENIDDNIGG